MGWSALVVCELGLAAFLFLSMGWVVSPVLWVLNAAVTVRLACKSWQPVLGESKSLVLSEQLSTREDALDAQLALEP